MNKSYDPQIWKKQDTILVKLPYVDFDQNASEHFKLMISSLIEKHECYSLILDFTNVMLVDGIGLASLLSAFNVCSEKDIKLLLCTLKPSIADLVKDKGLDTMVDIFDNMHEALDEATNNSFLRQKRDDVAKSFEDVFGASFEENIKYS
ncbi:MAG: STAS domain-containing protein [Vampirovibrionia bacterium]